MDKMKFKTDDLTEQNMEKIGALFPEVITEVKDKNGKLRRGINFELLKQLCSDENISEHNESYEFTWVGKRASFVEAGEPITKTLRPCEDESKNWDTTENLYIEGDNLDALKLLQRSYQGKVKMIYIDPPYNTGHDFIYKDHFEMDKEDYEEQTGLFDEEGNKNFQENNDSNPRFHSDWCSMIYPRLLVARNLLAENGVIFISIDDNEQANIVKILNEVFGEQNKVAELIVIRAEGGGLAKQVIKGHDYLFVYAKNINMFTPLGRPKDIRGTIIEKNGKKYWIQEDWLRKEFGKYGNCHYEEILKYKDEKTKQEIDKKLKKGEYILLPKNNGMNIVGKLRNIKEDSSKFYSILKHLSADGIKELQELKLDMYFSYPKPVSLLKELIRGATFFTAKEGDIILDFFSGSATTAHAVIQLNAEDGGHRKFIMVQLPELCDEQSEAYRAGYKNICEIGKERIRRAGEKIKSDAPLTTQDLDIGFRVFKVDESNMKDVYYTAGETEQSKLKGLVSNIKEDRSDMDLLYGCLLDWGVPVSLPHKREKIGGVDVCTVNNGDLIACFAPSVKEDVIREIAGRKPIRAVFRDSSFDTSPEKINVEEIFRFISPDTKLRVI